jgi:hypothetical protein
MQNETQPNPFDSLGFLIESTLDGSKTLRLKTQPFVTLQDDETPRTGESMHHSGGAFSETCYIYGPPLEWALKSISNPCVLSIGLGLGYVEILTATLATVHKNTSWSLDSFEIVDGLRAHFRDFILSENLQHPYQEILDRMAETFSVSAPQIKEQLKKALYENRLKLKGELSAKELVSGTYNVICQDAFSKKTNPDLWNEDFLAELMKSCDRDFAILSSYASLGPLKRAVKAAGFDLHVRDGFYGKRNCTLAGRGINPLDAIKDFQFLGQISSNKK